MWWEPSTGASSYDLQYAVETCPDTAIDEAAECTPVNWTEMNGITTNAIKLSAGSDPDDQLAIAKGAYNRTDPTGVYRIGIRAVNEVNRKSDWFSPVFIYPANKPPGPSKTLESTAVGGVRLPIIATAHLYAYQTNGIFSFVICDSTIPTGVNLDADGIERTIETWETAVRKDENRELISTNKLIGPLTVDILRTTVRHTTL